MKRRKKIELHFSNANFPPSKYKRSYRYNYLFYSWRNTNNLIQTNYSIYHWVSIRSHFFFFLLNINCEDCYFRFVTYSIKIEWVWSLEQFVNFHLIPWWNFLVEFPSAEILFKMTIQYALIDSDSNIKNWLFKLFLNQILFHFFYEWFDCSFDLFTIFFFISVWLNWYLITIFKLIEFWQKIFKFFFSFYSLSNYRYRTQKCLEKKRRIKCTRHERPTSKMRDEVDCTHSLEMNKWLDWW